MLEFKVLTGVPQPEYKTIDSVGMDIIAHSIVTGYRGDKEISPKNLKMMRETFQRGSIKIRGFERILFGTGLFIEEMESGTELQVRPRSGLALKRGLTVLNSPGTIEPDYPGEIGVILYNSTPWLVEVELEERIAQLVHAPVILDERRRGQDKRQGGFGSTN